MVLLSCSKMDLDCGDSLRYDHKQVQQRLVIVEEVCIWQILVCHWSTRVIRIHLVGADVKEFLSTETRAIFSGNQADEEPSL